MNKTTIIVGLAVLSLGLIGGCKPAPPTESADTGDPTKALSDGTNIILVTLDTTRADRIGCYGYDKASTPALNALAARGVLFEQAIAQAPLTLPSHATMMTGRYPRELGVRVNGRDKLGDAHVTLAAEAAKHGYATGGFVGASVLDAKYGIDRGFEIFGDDMGRTKGLHAHGDPQRRGAEVTDEALAWLDTVKDQKFFAWLHYYDPHHPYDAPAPFQNRSVDPYDNEIAYMDAQIKRVVDWLDARKLTDRTLIVLVGDHGEGFGEHGERGHTVFVYETNVHVPFLFVHPTLPPGRRVETVVEVADVFPTIFSLLGWTPPEGLLSRSLAGAIHGRDLAPVQSYSEAHHVSWSFGWAEQRALTTDRWKYISSTRPELFDRLNDPGELSNVIERYRDVAKQMREALLARFNAMTPGQAKTVVLDDKSRRELESLGYLSGGSALESQEFLTPGRPDPKDMLDAYHVMKRGFELLERGFPQEAIPHLREAAIASPMSMGFHYMLGAAYQESGQHAEAVTALQSALRIDPTYRSALSLLATSLVALERHDEAIVHYEVALKLDPTNASLKASVGQVMRRAGRPDDAAVYLLQAIESKPDHVLALNELGIIAQMAGDLKGASGFYRRAVEVKPNGTEGLYNLAIVLLRSGKAAEAAPFMRRAVELKPSLGGSVMTEGGAYAQKGKTAEAQACFAAVDDVEGVAVVARFNLAVMISRRNDRDATVTAYERVLEIAPAHDKTITALVNLYLSAKQTRKAVRMLRAAVADAPDSLTVLRPLASLLSTVPQDDLRDGTLAVELAERAAGLTQRKDPAVLATLGAALAEAGKFEVAAEVATEAIELARASDAGRLADFVEMQRAGYRTGRPFRDASLQP